MPNNKRQTYPSPPPSTAVVLACTGGYYVAWFLLQLLIHHIGTIFLCDQTYSHLLIPAALIFNVLIATGLTAFFLVCAEPGLNLRPALRIVLIIISLMTGAGLFALSRRTEANIIIQFLSTGNLLVLACLVGPWLTTALKRPSEIVLIAALVLMIDVISVLAGPTRSISDTLKPFYEGGMKGPAPFSDLLIIKTAIPGLKLAMPVFGLSDWVMLVFFAAACAKFNIRDNLLGEGMDEMIRKRKVRSLFLPISGAGLIAAVIAAQGLGLFLPALPFMALALILYLTIFFPETRRLEQGGWAAAVILIIVGAIIAIVSYLKGH